MPDSSEIDDDELDRRSTLNFAEMFTALGGAVGPKSLIRLPNVVGARFDAGSCPDFFNSVVVPKGMTPPEEDPGSHYVWTDHDAVAGRVEDTNFVIPTMGVTLDDPALSLDGAAANVDEPSLEELAAINERAYGEAGFARLARGIKDPRVDVHGLREDGEFVCVAMTVSVADDLGVHFVATEEKYKRRGLATSLVKRLLADGRRRGMRSATLQASPDGLPVWQRLGFVVRPYARPAIVK